MRLKEVVAVTQKSESERMINRINCKEVIRCVPNSRSSGADFFSVFAQGRSGRFTAGFGSLFLFLFFFAARAEAEQQRWKLQHQDYLPSVVSRLKPADRLNPTNQLRLAIGLPYRNQDQLEATIKALTDPASPRYHQWLTPGQFTQSFGPTEQDYEAVIHHMEAHGLKVAARYSNRALVSMTGAVADIEKTFGVTMRVYQHPTKNRTFYSADAVPSLDENIPVLGVSGLDNFDPPHPVSMRQKPVGYTSSQTYTNYAVNGSGPGGLVMGNDFRRAYAPGVSLDGSGQTVALIDGQTDPVDFTVYAQNAGLQVPNISYVYLDGTGPVPQPANDSGEADLDIEMIMSLAPRASILVYCGEADDCFIQMAIDNKARQISCSLGWGPASPMLGQEFQEFVAQGQSFFCASGDGGSGGDDANSAGSGPGDAANVTVVGGTSLSFAKVGGAWASETTWVGSGGATCVNIPIPDYQQGVSMSNNQGSTSYRNFPDVAAQADTDIFFIYGGGQSGAVGGTSAAAPLWAAFMALVNQQAALKGNPPVGFLNPLVYAIGKGSQYTSDFHDITTGNNENGSYPTMFSAVTGYDLCTGWGSPTGQPLIDALAGTNTAPNFSLSLLSSDVTNDQYSYIAPPGVLIVTQGTSASASITINPGNGFDGSVSLAVAGLPNGVSATFSPSSTSSASTLTLTASTTAPITGTGEVTIVGVGGGLTRTTTLAVIVVSAPVANLGFESPSLGSGNYAYNPAGASWTFGGSGASGGGIVANGSGFGNPNAPQGVQAGFVQAYGAISQTLGGFTPGTNYTITYSAAQRPGNSQSWNVMIDGNVIRSNSPGSSSYATYTASFTASSLFHTLSFVGADLAGGDNTVFIDNIVFSPALNPNQAAYTLSASMPAIWIIQGNSASTTIAVNPLNGFSNKVNLSIAGLPSGVTASFNPLSTTNSSTLTFTAAANAVIGTNAVTISGVSGGISVTTTLALVVVNAAQLAAPGIANPGFESPGITGYEYDPTNASWTFEDASPDGSGIVANGSRFANPNAPQGTQAAFIEEYSSISQLISGFIPGVNYTVTFSAAQRSGTGQHGGESWNVMVDDSVIGSFNPGPSATAYATYQSSFTAWETTHTLSFVGTDLTNGDNTIFLDDIAISISTNQLVPPGIALTSPVNNSLFDAPASVTLSADVATNGNQIDSVQFYSNSSLIGQVANPPYNYTWSNLVTGDYDVFAQVVYNGGSAMASGAAHFGVTNTASNLGFEGPSLLAGSYQYAPTGASWTFTGSAANTNGSGIVANGSALSNPAAPEGTQAAFLRERGTISQTLGGFVPGANYTLTYSAAQRPGNAQSWNVVLGGNVVQANNGPASTNYTTYLVNFTALAPFQTLTFAGTDLAGGDNTVFLDNIAISPDGNLGFEIPPLPSGTFQYDPTGGSWVFTGASPSGSGIVANGSGFGNPNVPQGNQAAFLQEFGSITQPISGFIPGTNYTILFSAAQRSGYRESWNLTVNGTVAGSYYPPSSATAFVNYSATFTATAPTETVGFVGTDQSGGDNTVFIDNVRIYPTPLSAPPTPTGLTAVAGIGQVSLSWKASSGATSYNVGIATVIGGPYLTVVNVTGTNFLNTDLVNGTTYYYVVSALNANGVSADSTQVSATPQVPAPSGLTALVGNGQAYLSWTPEPGAIGYLVQQATVNGGPYSTVANVTGTHYLQTGLSNGRTYYFVVSAMNSAGPTANSTQASATPPGTALTTLPDFSFETPAITGFQYAPTGGAWTFAGSSPNGSGIVSNTSGFSNPNAPQGTQAAFIQEKGTITQVISNLSTGIPYQINFQAAQRPDGGSYNVGGESWNVTINGVVIASYRPGESATTYSNFTANFTATSTTETLALVGTDLAGGDNSVFIDDVQIAVVPAAPLGLAATPGSGQVSLSWSPSTGATSYNVERSTVSGGPYATVTNVTGTNAIVLSLTNNTTYYFVVAAQNASGTSVNSAQVSATPEPVPLVTLVSPSNNAVFGVGSPINLAASVTTNGNSIVGVQFFANSTNLIAQVGAPYTYVWTNASAGTYGVFAQLIYNTTNLVDSTTNTVVVTNPPPAIVGIGFGANGLISISGTGLASNIYYLCTTTNLAPPVVWNLILTNLSDAAGNIVFTNLAPTNMQQYFLISTP